MCRFSAALALGVGAPLLECQTSATAAFAAHPVESALPTGDAPGAPEPPATVEAALKTMFTSADIVFTGEVLSIEHAQGAVKVRWQVAEAVRGVSTGEYVLREWAGLWAGDSARYAVGEHALVLLHGPSPAGYASPVGGLDGVIPLRGDAAGSVLDLRWLAQHVAVSDAARLQPLFALRAAGGSFELASALQARSATKPNSVAHLPRRAGDAGIPASESPVSTAAISYAQVDGTMVLGMLHAWQRASGGAR